MCGIIGIWAQNNVGKQQVQHVPAALNNIAHRGPDHKAYKLYSNCGFGHTRLSIIDTDSRSNQPFLSEDGRYCLIFNGEIYNYLQLKNELVANGHTFRTSSDTEVLLKLLILEGKEALDKLDGFFAFAFYDSASETVLLARDRMGIKPLLVYQDETKILFGSELAAFQAFDINDDIDVKALSAYFGLTYIPAPHGIFSGLAKVRPGEFIFIEKGQMKTGRYYTPKVQNYRGTYEEAVQKVRTLLKESVKNRMIADVPLGAFLSGGVDSSIIAALAIQHNPQLNTFSVGFDHAYFNETDYANEVARHIGSNHHAFTITKADFKANFSAFLQTIDAPFADSSAFAVYLLSKKAKEQVSVVLSGDGADELFGGYRKHYAEYQLRNTGKLKAAGINLVAGILNPLKQNRKDKIGEFNRKVQKFKKGLALEPVERYLTWCQFIAPAERKKLLRQEPGFPTVLSPQNWEELNTVLFADQELVLANDMLRKVDAMSMAHALEARTPFLDHRLVEFANSLPFSFKVDKTGGKRILKDAFADILPGSVLKRPKKGFEIPVKDWLSDEIHAILDGPLFSLDYIENQGLFNYDYLKDLGAAWTKPGFADKIYMVWALIIFQNWWDRTVKMSQIS